MPQFLAAIFLMMALAGCVHQPAGTAGMHVIPDVPAFDEQTRGDDCGSVALASLLAHSGHVISSAIIDQAIYDPVVGGSLLLDMENFAAARGTSPRSGRGDLETLRSLLAGGDPVLLPIDLGWSSWRRPHYVVVFGYSEDDFLMYQRAGAPNVMPAKELERRWQKMGRLYLYLE